MEMKSSNINFAACTIIAKNYLPMARALAESWHAVHPDSPFFVLLLDSPQGFFNPESEDFHTVLASDLDIPNLNGFLFKYTVLEASTAVKPYFLDYLFQRHSISKLLYLDPDILIFRPLDYLADKLETANVLLTPHLLSPLPNDGRGLTEHDILQAGSYNLGFFGVRNSLESKRLLSWWSEKLYHHCIVSFQDNLFVDQRWMDMVPGLFDGVEIIRHPGFNVAYWNLHERTISVKEQVTVNELPLYFFHFSGFDPNKPWIVSKYQNRFEMATIGDARKLYSDYRELLVKKGWVETSAWTYAHDFFSNGVKIPPSARKFYWSLGPDVAHLGDPFLWLTSEAKIQGTYERSQFPPGVNLLGYFGSEKGVGEGTRSNLRIIRSTGIPYCINNQVDTRSQNLERLPDRLTSDNPYRVNLLTINADGLLNFGPAHPSYLAGHYNIGYWAWELPEFPAEWAASFGYADEVWTPSRFTRDSVASRSPVPVRVVPHSLEIDAQLDIHADRSAFGIDDHVFLFLFIFDFHSFTERKNPLGLVEAYKKAFGTRKDVQLLLKSGHGSDHEEELRKLQHAFGGANIRLLDAVLTHQQVQSLIKTADCYVSLHRSEGFGLTMAEAMLYGKPVIATGYSGNVDFMSDEDSFLVPYRLITIRETHGPYRAGYHWADPDLDSACDLMRYVETNREAAAAVGQRARRKVSELLHPATIAASVRTRLEELGLLGNSVVSGPQPVFASGVNLLGYFQSEKGVGEIARSNLRTFQATGLPYCVNNRVDSGSKNVECYPENLRIDNPYQVNVIALNGDGYYDFATRNPTYFAGHFNIAYWAWELPEFPPEWAPAFEFADEIWTCSQFGRDSIAAASPVPVRAVPLSLEIGEGVDALGDRSPFGIDEGTFLFLFLFDFHSFLERKNPLGLIKAYKNAFGNRKDVQLLIKSAHSAEHQRELKLLQRACEGANVRILDAVLTRQEKQNLMKAADCYVSLHRSEGFGLTMAEAMLYGKPVIATGYSGNLDFMSNEDSYLVPHRLITIKQTHGPYKAGFHWANPDLDAAADIMRYIESNREAASAVGCKAQAKVRELLHPKRIAPSVRARLEELGLLGPRVPLAVPVQEGIEYSQWVE